MEKRKRHVVEKAKNQTERSIKRIEEYLSQGDRTSAISNFGILKKVSHLLEILDKREYDTYSDKISGLKNQIGGIY